MTNIEASNDQTGTWMEALRSIAEILGSDTVDMWLSELKVDMSSNCVTLFVKDNFRADIIRRRLVPYIEDAFKKQGIVSNVKIVCKMCSPGDPLVDERQFAEKVISIWGPDFCYLGMVDLQEEGTYVLLRTPLDETGQEGVMIFELDTFDPEITCYSFSIPDSDSRPELIPKIICKYCEKYGPKFQK